MADEALRIPVELKEIRFVRSNSTVEFARFLLETELGSYRPDPEFGCRSPYFTPEYTEDIRVAVRNHVLEQFRRYMGITVNVAISENVTQPTATLVLRVTGTDLHGHRFALSWEV